MNTNHPQHRRLWWRITVGIANVFAVTLIASLGYAAWEYTTWRNEMIEWDYGTIDRLCGGDTEADRLLEIRFIKQWEYKALKQTSNGKEVWIHWKLSKRRCGNWMLVDKPKGFVIQPMELRFPKGVPHRQGFSCLGI